MPELTKLTVRVLGDVTDLRSKMSKAEKTMEQFGYNMKRTGKALTAGLTLPIAAVGTAATKMASDAAEAANKFDVVMGPAAARLRDRFEELHDIIPATRAEMEQLTSGVQDLLVPLGIARDEAANMSLAMLELGADIGSFNNVATPDVLNAFKSALAGQSRPMRQFGIDVSQARLQAIALEEGLLDASGAMSTAARAQAVLIAATQDSTDAIGDSERTAKDAANQFRFLMRNVKELAITIGEQLLPVVTPLVNQMNDAIKAAGGLNSSIVQWTIAVGAVVAAIGPLLLILGKLTQTFVALRVAGMAALPIFGIGGLLVLGLGALAANFIKNKLEAAEFASELRTVASDAREAASALEDMTKAQVAGILAGRLNAIERLKAEQQRMIAERREELAGRGQFGVGGAFSDAQVAETFTGQQEVAFQNLERAIESTTGAVAGLLDQLDQLDAGAGVSGGGGAGGSVAARTAGLVNSRVGLESQRGLLMRLLAERESRGGTISPGLLDTSIARRVDPLYRKPKPEDKPGMADTLLQPFKQLGPQAMALGAVFEMLKGAMEPLKPVLETLKEPLQQIGHLFGIVLAPVVELLAISMEGLMKGVSYVMTAFGWLVEGLGWLIDKLIGWLTNWGDKLQDWGKELQRTAKSMRDGTHAAEGLADALGSASRVLNAPNGFKAELARFNATNAGGGSSTTGPGKWPIDPSNPFGGKGPRGASATFTGDIHINGNRGPREMWEDFKEGARRAADSGDPDAMALSF